MEITVVSEGRNKVEVPENSSIEEVLEGLDINRETVLVRVNGNIKAEDDELEGGDVVEIIRVVSGG